MSIIFTHLKHNTCCNVKQNIHNLIYIKKLHSYMISYKRTNYTSTNIDHIHTHSEYNQLLEFLVTHKKKIEKRKKIGRAISAAVECAMWFFDFRSSSFHIFYLHLDLFLGSCVCVFPGIISNTAHKHTYRKRARVAHFTGLYL